jgi:hypothetical protein
MVQNGAMLDYLLSAGKKFKEKQGQTTSLNEKCIVLYRIYDRRER